MQVEQVLVGPKQEQVVVLAVQEQAVEHPKQVEQVGRLEQVLADPMLLEQAQAERQAVQVVAVQVY